MTKNTSDTEFEIEKNPETETFKGDDMEPDEAVDSFFQYMRQKAQGQNHVLNTLKDCARELTIARYERADSERIKPGDVPPTQAERDAREILAPLMQDVTEEEREEFRLGRLGPKTPNLRVVEGGDGE